ncbi:PfkB domain-containing protein [Heracleum sosnowskyi]|uniref:PfkB domain-containing protein n=1 Tax=Heracleum sosnowskyi TaxID=360622 RepID=A0AAD8ICG4_9APIA|nr:PfkB domain-containing protein [Heracleum sosnowskyi]
MVLLVYTDDPFMESTQVHDLNNTPSHWSLDRKEFDLHADGSNVFSLWSVNYLHAQRPMDGTGVYHIMRSLLHLYYHQEAHRSGVPVILDAGGADGPVPSELLNFVDILSPNETELARLTGLPTENFEQISKSVDKCHKLGVDKVLVKLGAKGSALFIKGKEPIKQPIISASKVLDTTGAGDTFTAAFAIALVEEKSERECMTSTKLTFYVASFKHFFEQQKSILPRIRISFR